MQLLFQQRQYIRNGALLGEHSPLACSGTLAAADIRYSSFYWEKKKQSKRHVEEQEQL